MLHFDKHGTDAVGKCPIRPMVRSSVLHEYCTAVQDPLKPRLWPYHDGRSELILLVYLAI